MRSLHLGVTIAICLAVSTTADARAQLSGDGFLFRAPTWSVTLRGGLAVPRAQSDVFTFTSEQLTVDRGDFKSFAVGVDADMRVLGWTHVVLSFDNAHRSKRSEFRDYVDNNDLPIEQSTEFTRFVLSLGVKQYLLNPGRSIGKLAWVPSRVAPFVGAGVGAMRYDFSQHGDFVDFQDMDIFSAQFRSVGWTPTAHARGGLEYSVSPMVALIAEGRYEWAKGATLSRDFAGFDRIDLTGFSTTAGLTVRF